MKQCPRAGDLFKMFNHFLKQNMQVVQLHCLLNIWGTFEFGKCEFGTWEFVTATSKLWSLYRVTESQTRALIAVAEWPIESKH